MARKGQKNANYNFSVQKEPPKPMGSGSFANMPDGAFVKPYSKNHGMRDGIINSFTCDITETSGIHENEAYE